jgi:hypothetical protein
VKKILSILLALSVILGLTAMAVPAGAADPCATISATNDCAGETATYTIVYKAPVTLTAANDLLSVTFPTGTTFGTFVLGDVKVNGVNVDPITLVVVTDSKIVFPVPALIPGGMIVAGTTVTIVINKVINGPAGTNPICLDYKLVCCDEVEFCCVDFTIVPAISTLGFHFDFSPTYTGLAEDFIPPFKACGQECYGTYNSSVGWLTNFDLILRDDVPGCNPPCTNASMWFVLTACPAGETVTFLFDSGGANMWFTLDDTDVGDVQALPNVTTMPPPDVEWPCKIHFSSPGQYELCFYVECPAVPCTAGKQIVAEECMPCKAYQWKEACKIPLYRKWNLICLPLVPLEDPPIADMLDACTFKDEVMSIWYYDRCEDYPAGQWYVWPTPTGTQKSLTDLEDGKSYWVRIVYDSAHPSGDFIGYLWTWGTPQPTPPASPSAYEVCEGWNMVGLTGHDGWMSWGAPIRDEDYLWNWFDNGWPEYGGIYGWMPYGFNKQSWWSVTPVGNWLPKYYTGEGYWISFEHDGMIYPP